MKISHALGGFLLFKRVQNLSPRTLELYERQLTQLTQFLNDSDLATITVTDLRRFLNYLQSDYVPTRFNRDTRPLSPRTLRNYWVALRSFWTWVSAELDVPDIAASIPAPRVTDTPIVPLSEAEISRLLACCTTTADGRRNPYALRNRALILLLLDTGIRVSELCALVHRDIDLKSGRVKIESGKGAKKRIVYIGDATRRALWRYQAEHFIQSNTSPIFPNLDGKPISRHRIRRVLADLGIRAKIKDCYPHRFRHTFAIQYLRNGGDIFTLQRLLGHSTLEMVRRYLALADIDSENAHRRASPADNWRL